LPHYPLPTTSKPNKSYHEELFIIKHNRPTDKTIKNAEAKK